jgi:hypothetical protein
MKVQTTSRNYTGHGWQGENYDGYLSSKEICKLIREQLKRRFPTSKFSVSKEDYAGGRKIYIALMSTYFNPFVNEINVDNEPDEYRKQQKLNHFNSVKEKMSTGVNQYNIEDDYILTQQAKNLMKDVINTVQSFNYDDSDSMIDYFDTNFYTSFSIGKWDKPFTQTQ